MNTKAWLCAFISTLSFAVYGTEVPKEAWLNAMSTQLPAAFCSASQYFRQCFTVTAVECEEVAASATRICINANKAKIPSTLVQPKDGSHWGYVIGECAGSAYETSLLKKRVNSEKCRDPKNWK